MLESDLNIAEDAIVRTLTEDTIHKVIREKKEFASMTHRGDIVLRRCEPLLIDGNQYSYGSQYTLSQHSIRIDKDTRSFHCFDYEFDKNFVRFSDDSNCLIPTHQLHGISVQLVRYVHFRHDSSVFSTTIAERKKSSDTGILPRFQTVKNNSKGGTTTVFVIPTYMPTSLKGDSTLAIIGIINPDVEKFQNPKNEDVDDFVFNPTFILTVAELTSSLEIVTAEQSAETKYRLDKLFENPDSALFVDMQFYSKKYIEQDLNNKSDEVITL